MVPALPSVTMPEVCVCVCARAHARACMDAIELACLRACVRALGGKGRGCICAGPGASTLARARALAHARSCTRTHQ